MFYLDQMFYKFTINLTKLSILTLYLRIFTKTWFVRTCWACFTVVSCYAIASILISVFQCTPINYFWDHEPPPKGAPRGGQTKDYGAPSSPHPHCINNPAFWVCNAVYNIGSDLIILSALPFMIWSLRLPRQQKIGLTFVFSLGIFVCSTSVLRLTTLPGAGVEPDPLVGTVISTMWTMIESSTAVVCACLPMCRTPLQRAFPHLLPSRCANRADVEARPRDPTSTAPPNADADPKSKPTVSALDAESTQGTRRTDSPPESNKAKTHQFLNSRAVSGAT
ncbi:hypothetical protein HC762_01300 [bacterium]|nr:hypothetical protein [bacterium]